MNHITRRVTIASTLIASFVWFALITQHPALLSLGRGTYAWSIVEYRIASVLFPAVACVGWVLLHCSNARGDGETRCRKCRHILRGLTEPRCPECGEAI